MNYSVYMHIFPNGKKYIGITGKDPEERWGYNGHGYNIDNQPLMKKAIIKYGWNNIEHVILYQNLSEDEAKEKEIELIEQYHTFYKDPQCNGYNMTAGGEGRKLLTEDQKAQRVVEVAQYKKQWASDHPESIKQSTIKRKEKKREYDKQYRLTNYEDIQKRKKEYYDSHKKEKAEYDKIYRAKRKQEMIDNGTYDDWCLKRSERAKQRYLNKNKK